MRHRRQGERVPSEVGHLSSAQNDFAKEESRMSQRQWRRFADASACGTAHNAARKTETNTFKNPNPSFRWLTGPRSTAAFTGYSSPALDLPPYDFFRLPFFGGPSAGRLPPIVFGLPRPLPRRPELSPAVRRFRPAFPPFIVSLVVIGFNGPSAANV